MIPLFPNFKKIELIDKKEVEEFTKNFPPYSDFNFVSMWSWDIKGEMIISQLNNNLVVRFTDYLTGNPFFSFLGDRMVNETTEALLEFSKKEGFDAELKLMPEDVIKRLDNTKFKIVEDRDHFDYIFSVSQLIDLKGIKYKEKRHLVSRFLREHPNAFFELKKLNDIDIQKQIISVLRSWKNKKEIDNKVCDIKHEEEAINRLLQTANNHNLIVGCVFLNHKMIGFSIDEILPSNYAISHFFKTDNSHNGVSDFLNNEMSKYLLAQGVKFWNWEQDLGVGNLRKSKMNYHPVEFLKKYKISFLSKK